MMQFTVKNAELKFKFKDALKRKGKFNMIPFEQYEKSADFLRKRLDEIPEIAIVLGSGLGGLALQATSALSIPYEEIPGFVPSTVQSHAGVAICGNLNGQRVFMLSGRFHVYEGYSPEIVSFYVRVMHLLGVKKLLLTNAAGGVNQNFKIGDFMLISDHIKFFNESPVRGANIPQFGQRFFDLSRLYSPRMRDIARGCGDKLGIVLQEGVYFYMPGPEFETPAEIRAIRALGGDAVGMSTVFEAVTAAHCGLEVMGVSCITNMAAGVIPNSLVSDAEVTENAALVSDKFCDLMKAIISDI